MIQRYSAKTGRSAALHQRAIAVMAGGVSHDIYLHWPHPLYVSHARGPVKWDADGRLLIDYWMGHGALLLGHNPPFVVRAIRSQLENGTHYGACHALSVLWAEIIQELVPSADRVRFVASGTEGALLAMKIARVATNRSKIIRISGHFHGWDDSLILETQAEENLDKTGAVQKDVIVAKTVQIADVKTLIEDSDIAGLILEPGGGSSGAIPVSQGSLKELRRVTEKSGIVLIFDEVVSGFRYAPGGVQERHGVLPDLTILGKILAGGLPGAAVVGREGTMKCFRSIDPAGILKGELQHTGTFNANPISAAAGIATLELVRNGEPQKKAESAARLLAITISEIIESLGVDAYVYNSSSILHFLLEPTKFGIPAKASKLTPQLFALNNPGYRVFRSALISNGVDMHPCHAWVSSRHGKKEINLTVRAFTNALRAYFG